jgi:hypothetical protein
VGWDPTSAYHEGDEDAQGLEGAEDAERDEVGKALDEPIRRPVWWRWVAGAVVAGMLLTGPAFLLLRAAGFFEPRLTFAIPLGAVVEFSPEEIEPGDLVRCGGTSITVPGPGETTPAGPAGSGAALSVATTQQGAVIAVCRARG